MYLNRILVIGAISMVLKNFVFFQSQLERITLVMGNIGQTKVSRKYNNIVNL